MQRLSWRGRNRKNDIEVSREETNRPCRDGSTVRVHDLFDVVVWEGILKPGLDDHLRGFRWGSGREHANTFFPQAEVTEDAFDHLAVIDMSVLLCDLRHVSFIA